MPHILKRNLVSAKAAQQVRAELLKKLEENKKETNQLKHDDGTVQDLQDLDDGTRTELDGEECEEECEEEMDRMDEGQTGKKVLENEVLNPELWPDNQVGLYGWGDEQETQVPRPVTTPVRCQTEFEVKGTKAPTMSGDECPEIPFTQPDPEIIDDEVPTMDDAYQLNEVALDEVTDDRSLEESWLRLPFFFINMLKNFIFNLWDVKWNPGYLNINLWIPAVYPHILWSSLLRMISFPRTTLPKCRLQPQLHRRRSWKRHPKKRRKP